MFLPNSGHYGRTWEFSICTEINHLNTFCPLLLTRLLPSWQKSTSEPQLSLKILYIFLYYYLKDPRQNFLWLVSVQDQFLNSSFLLYALWGFLLKLNLEGSRGPPQPFYSSNCISWHTFFKNPRCFYHVLTINRDKHL